MIALKKIRRDEYKSQCIFYIAVAYPICGTFSTKFLPNIYICVLCVALYTACYVTVGKLDVGNDMLVSKLTSKVEEMRIQCSDITDKNAKLQTEYDKAKDEV